MIKLFQVLALVFLLSGGVMATTFKTKEYGAAFRREGHHNRKLWYDDDYYQPFLVDTTQLLGGPGTLFSQEKFNGRDDTVLVAKITPTIVKDTNVRCELTCTTPDRRSDDKKDDDDYYRRDDDYYYYYDEEGFEEVLINMRFGKPPRDIFDDGIEAISDKCPISLSLNSFKDADLFVTVANAGGPLLDGSVICTSTSGPSPSPTPSPTKPPVSPQPICFSEQSTVQVQGKGSVEMKDLQLNDKVWVGNKGNTTLYEAVYAFGHYQPTQATDYLKIHTSSSWPSSALEISAAHLLYLEGKEDPVRADTVQPGDVLKRTTLDASGGTTYYTAVVTDVEPITRKGAYMPLTKSGSIVVNGYHASAYVSILDDAPRVVTKFQSFISEQTLLHWWLAPYRMVCLGISSKLCENDYDEEEGIAYWLVVGRYIARVGDTWWLGFQLVGLVVFTLFMATCMALETMIDHFWLLCSSIGFLLVLARVARGAGSLQKQALKTD